LTHDHPHTSSPTHNLSLSRESGGEAAHVLGEIALVAEELDVGTVDLDLALLALLDVLLTAERGETPVAGDNDLLATGELETVRLCPFETIVNVTYLVLATAQSLESSGAVGVPSPDGHEDLANVHTSDKTVGLAESTTHTGLKPISSSARQHLVDTDDMVGVDADTEMERLLSGSLDHVLVGANTGGLESLGRQLLVLVGNKVDAEREVVDVRAFAAEIEDADLGVRYTTVEPALGVLQTSQSTIPPQDSGFLVRRTGLFLQ
jgi:hypothetical protein